VEPDEAQVRLALAPLLLALAACATGAGENPRYEWASYEKSAWRLAENRDGISIADEIRVITIGIEQADAHARLVPPGVHAHLGYLYAITGNPDSAIQQFEIEKQLYPEATVFLDGCIQRMKR
jgi:hypothetical protein